jgi:hypothetical protein
MRSDDASGHLCRTVEGERGRKKAEMRLFSRARAFSKRRIVFYLLRGQEGRAFASPFEETPLPEVETRYGDGVPAGSGASAGDLDGDGNEVTHRKGVASLLLALSIHFHALEEYVDEVECERGARMEDRIHISKLGRERYDGASCGENKRGKLEILVIMFGMYALEIDGDEVLVFLRLLVNELCLEEEKERKNLGHLLVITDQYTPPSAVK